MRWVFDSYTHQPDLLSQLREIRVLQIRLIVEYSVDFHLQFHHPESAVVEHDDFDREIVLLHRQQITQQHGEAAISRHRDYLSSGITKLSPNGLRERVCHRPVSEGADQATVLRRSNVPRRPDVTHARISSKDRVVCRNLTH